MVVSKLHTVYSSIGCIQHFPKERVFWGFRGGYRFPARMRYDC